MKRCLSSLPKRKMQSKILVRYNSIRMAFKKILLIPSGYGATGTLISVGMQNNRTTLGKNLTGSQKLNINLPFSPTILFLRIYHHVDYSPQAKFSSIQIGPDTFVFVLFLAASDNSGVEHLQQRLYSLQSQKYLLILSIPSQKKFANICPREKNFN